MKTKLILILTIAITLFSCRSKNKVVKNSETEKTEIASSSAASVEKIKDSTFKEVKKTEKTNQNTNQNSGDIIIKGSSESGKDFEFSNVVGGDTLSTIKIKGNATFEIKNKFNKSKTESENVSRETELNIVAKLARKSVSKETIKKVAEKVKEAERTVKSSGFQAPVYIIIGLVSVVGIIVIILLRKFKNKS